MFRTRLVSFALLAGGLVLAHAAAAGELAEAARGVEEIIAHRGASAERPENTMAAIERAIEVEATGVEIDIRTTRDGHLVLLHDATVDRTTDGRGAVGEMTLEALRQLDAGSWFDPQYAGERAPTLAEALAACRGEVDVVLDLKEEGGVYAERIARTVRRYGDAERTVVGVRSLEQVELFRRLLPKSPQMGLIPRADAIEDFAAAGVETIRLWPSWLEGDPTLADRVRRSGARLHLNEWTGAREAVVPLLVHRPVSFFTDDPRRLATTLAELRGEGEAQGPEEDDRASAAER